jgi:hypothetical protein
MSAKSKIFNSPYLLPAICIMSGLCSLLFMLPWLAIFHFDKQTVGTVIKCDTEKVGNRGLVRVVIEYQYNVDGRTIINNKYGLWDDAGSENWAKQVVEKYQNVNECTVYFSSTYPKYSVLSLTPHFNIVVIATAFGILSAMALAGAVFQFKKAKKGKAIVLCVNAGLFV